ncbi:MAG: DUF3332 family protein [Desulfuromonadales bacterium]|nr:DUF3332 family protein [Desulfuromonadales bacterium]
MKRPIALLLLLIFALTGCAGTFSRKVYQFEKEEGDKWVKEIAVIVLVALPLNELTVLSDAVVYNAVAVWSGKKPDKNLGVKPMMIGQGQSGVALLLFDNVQRKISLQLQGQTKKDWTFLPAPAGVVAKDAQGEVDFSAVTASDGSIVVYGRDSELLQRFSAEQIAVLAGQQNSMNEKRRD